MTIDLLTLALVIFLAAIGLASGLAQRACAPCTGNCRQGRDCDCVPTLDEEVTR